MFTRTAWGKQCTEVDTDTCTKLHKCTYYDNTVLVCKFLQSIVESCWDSCLCEHLLGWSQAILFGAWLHDAEVSAEEYLNQHGQYGPWITLLTSWTWKSVKMKRWKTVKQIFALGCKDGWRWRQHRFVDWAQNATDFYIVKFNKVAFKNLAWCILFFWYFFRITAAGCADQSGWTGNPCASRWASAS